VSARREEATIKSGCVVSYFRLAGFLRISVSSVSAISFPTLVPYHGAGERFTFGPGYTYQIPWHAITKLHLTFQANETVKLYANNQYICDCTSYQFTVEPDDTVLIRMEANSPVSGMFTAWQEIPLEKQLLALTLLSAGLAGIAISVISIRKK